MYVKNISERPRSATTVSRALGALKSASDARDDNTAAKQTDFLIFKINFWFNNSRQCKKCAFNPIL